MTLDTRAYLARIGYDGPQAPTLEVLSALQRHHIGAIAFETLAMLLGEPVRLDLQSLEQKILRDGRGGYCFELNLLFLNLLRALGFEAHALTGRVLMNAPPGTVPARTHVLLHVTINDEQFTVDVGFGGLTPTAPLRLRTEEPQLTPNETYRFVKENDNYLLQARVGDAWRPLYAFDLTAPADIDFEVGNWYVSTHPNSPFRGRLLVARAEPGIRHALRGRDYTVHRIGAASEHREITDPAALTELLRSVFGLRVPDHPALDDALRAAVEAPST